MRLGLPQATPVLRSINGSIFMKKSQSSFAILKPSLRFFKFNDTFPVLVEASSSMNCGFNISSKSVSVKSSSCDSSNSWMSLDSICSKPSRTIPFAISAMFAVKVWICTDSSSFSAVRTGHSFFQHDFNVYDFSSSNDSFMFTMLCQISSSIA